MSKIDEAKEPSLSKECSSRKPRLLDCFCGMGGVSDGFALEGFDVTGIDIVDAPKMLGYKHKFIQADMQDWFSIDIDYSQFDVMWASPPCRDFSNMAYMGKGSVHKDGSKFAWKIPPNPNEGLKLVKAFLDLIDWITPTFWVLENVQGLSKYLDMAPRAIGSKIKGGKHHVFYGNFPSLLIPQTEAKINIIHQQGKLRSWERAKIPLACSRAFAKACREALDLKVLEIKI